MSITTRIVFWEGYKGIDDAAKAESVIFTTLSIPEWFATLKGDPVNEVKKVWNEIGYHLQPIGSVDIQPLSPVASLDLARIIHELRICSLSLR